MNAAVDLAACERDVVGRGCRWRPGEDRLPQSLNSRGALGDDVIGGGLCRRGGLVQIGRFSSIECQLLQVVIRDCLQSVRELPWTLQFSI